MQYFYYGPGSSEHNRMTAFSLLVNEFTDVHTRVMASTVPGTEQSWYTTICFCDEAAEPLETNSYKSDWTPMLTPDELEIVLHGELEDMYVLLTEKILELDAEKDRDRSPL